MDQGDSGEFFDYMLEFDVVGLEELAPGGHVVEEIAHREGGSAGAGDFFGGDMAGVVEDHLAACRGVGGACAEGDFGDCGY